MSEEKLFQIKHRFSGSILFELKTTSFRLCVEAAIKASADLSSADLSSDVLFTGIMLGRLRLT